LLRPELERVEGFVDNIQYRSLNREGWILSLSNWEDEKAMVRWRTKMKHHEVQELGRGEVLLEYHLSALARSHTTRGYMKGWKSESQRPRLASGLPWFSLTPNALQIGRKGRILPIALNG
jgi:heme-degrading monooxygenase HmoA